MTSLMIILIASGAALVVSAVFEAVAPFPYVTTRRRALRLKRLSNKLTTHLESATNNTQECYEILRVLLATTSSDVDVMQAIGSDQIWRRARLIVLVNAQRARWVAWRMMRQHPEPAVLLARQCFRSLSSTCTDCPMLKLQPNQLGERCPSMDAFGERR